MENLTTIYEKKFKKSTAKSYPFFQQRPVHPYQVIGSFFNAGDVVGYLEISRRLFASATSERLLKKELHSMMYDHKLFSELLNATWIIYKTKVKCSAMPLQKDVFVVSGGHLDISIIKKFLMEDEMNNPYLGFFHCYKDFELAAYHRNLYYWFFFSLTDKDFLVKDKETRKIYKNLCKMIICSWLIYENELLERDNNGK